MRREEVRRVILFGVVGKNRRCAGQLAPGGLLRDTDASNGKHAAAAVKPVEGVEPVGLGQRQRQEGQRGTIVRAKLQSDWHIAAIDGQGGAARHVQSSDRVEFPASEAAERETVCFLFHAGAPIYGLK
jgi:hypothetical protein